MSDKLRISFINDKFAADLTKPFSRNYRIFERDVKLVNFIAFHFAQHCFMIGFTVTKLKLAC